MSKCIDSILAQTYQEYEIILVNDGSTDKSGRICMKYIENRDNIFYYEQENFGVSVARNVGIKHSSGEWIMFVDPDDYLKPDLLQHLFEHTDSETDIVACCCEVLMNGRSCLNCFWDGNRKFYTETEKMELIKQIFSGEYGQPQKKYISIGVPWGKLFRRDMLIRNRLEFHPKLRRMQDNIFNMYAFWMANQIVYINEPLYCYRMEHILSYTDVKCRPFLYDNSLRIQQERIKFMKEANLWDNKEMMDFFYAATFTQILTIFNSYILHDANPDSRKVKCKKALEILHSQKGCYREAIEKLRFVSLSSKKHKILLLLFKLDSFWIIYLVWNIRNLAKKLKIC